MLNFFGSIIILTGAVMCMTGAIFASQQEHYNSADILLMAVAAGIFGKLMISLGDYLGKGNTTTPTVS